MNHLFSFANLKKAFRSPRVALSYLWGVLWYKLGLQIPASQFWEDLILSYLIPKKKGFYVDIGANDPCMGNNTYLFHTRWWSGITIEPNKRLHAIIAKRRKWAINLNLAVWKKGALRYYELDAHGMSTCDESVRDMYVSKWHTVTNTYETPVEPLSSIFDQYLWWNSIDVLSVDVEWMDMEVLCSNNWEKYKPSYIVVETLIYKGDGTPWKRDDEKYTTYLAQYGYTPIANTYVNTIYQLNTSHEHE